MSDEDKSIQRAEKLLNTIAGPDDLTDLDDEQLQGLAQEVRELIIDTIGEIGGHFGANLGTCELAVALHSMLESPRDKILWDVGHQAYPAQGPDRPPRRPRQHPSVRGPGAVLLGVRVRARHHGRRPRFHLDRLRGRAEGGDAQGHRHRRQGRRRDRRRGAHRRRRLRGAAPRRRAADADRDRAQRQRHVDLAERRRDLPLLQPDAAEPALVRRALEDRGAPHQPAAGPGPADRAPGARGQGGDQGLLGAGPVLRGARPRLRRRHRRSRRRCPARGARGRVRGKPPGRRPHPHRQGQGLRARRGGWPGGDGEVARRQAGLASSTARRRRRNPTSR